MSLIILFKFSPTGFLATMFSYAPSVSDIKDKLARDTAEVTKVPKAFKSSKEADNLQSREYKTMIEQLKKEKENLERIAKNPPKPLSPAVKKKVEVEKTAKGVNPFDMLKKAVTGK